VCPLEGYLTLNGESCNHKNDLYMKKCTKCKIEKELTEFHIEKRAKDGLSFYCKVCESERSKEKRIRTKQRKKIVLKEKECLKCNKIKDIDEFTINNEVIDGHSRYCKTCLHKHEKIDRNRRINSMAKSELEKHRVKNRKKDKKYYTNNREELIKKKSKYIVERIKNDAEFKLLMRCRGRLNRIVKTKGIRKHKPTVKLIGCSVKELKMYIESKFTKGMSWDTYGNNGWHIDHIIPCDDFDLTKPEEQCECFHYTNLQPLWATTEIAMKHGESENYIGNLNKNSKLNLNMP